MGEKREKIITKKLHITSVTLADMVKLHWVSFSASADIAFIYCPLGQYKAANGCCWV